MLFSLPTEVEWECCLPEPATATPLWYGGLDSDFSAAGQRRRLHPPRLGLSRFASSDRPSLFYRDARLHDGAFVRPPKSAITHPDPWGLHDTCTATQPKSRLRGMFRTLTATATAATIPPRRASVGPGRFVGTRPERCRSSFRLSYEAYQRIFNVGFRRD